MNWLDVILIIIILICVIGGIVLLTLSIVDGEIDIGVMCCLCCLFSAGLCTLPFVVLDKASGSTMGTLTSVDKNFFGTTAVYIKTSETEQEEYCIEFNDKLEEQAKNLIGKKIIITYGERIGLYSTAKCSQAPIESIEMISNE